MNKRHQSINQLRPRPAFTLAEVLITLGIIGVVAAMTIPILINQTQEQAWKSAYKKTFSAIAQAFEQVKQDEGGDLSKYFTSGQHYAGGTADVVNMMGKYLKYTKSCGIPNSTDYYSFCGVIPATSIADSGANAYKTLGDSYVLSPNFIQGQYILNDGVHLFFRTWNTNGLFLIFVDTNGWNKGPNTLGKDLLGISVSKDKVMPMGAIGTGIVDNCTTTAYSCTSAIGWHGGRCEGAGCSAKILYGAK